MNALAEATPVRRGSLSIALCDAELTRIAKRLGELTGESKDRLFDDADRWLDHRIELMENRARMHKALG